MLSLGMDRRGHLSSRAAQRHSAAGPEYREGGHRQDLRSIEKLLW